MALATRDEGATEIVTADGEVLDLRAAPSALEAVTRAEIDRQIATAKAFPRSVTRFLNEAKSIVAADPDLAAQCTFYLPGRGGKKDQPITGPSVRLAEIVALCWGNLRIVGRISDDDGRFLTAQAIAMDLEKNVGYTIEVQRGVTNRDGRRYSDDMIRTTGNAAISIATRNATFKVVPRAFVNLIEEEAQRVARGDVKSLPDRTARAVSWFSGKGITEERVFAALGIGGPADMTLDLLVRLQGLKTALTDGQATADEVFPVPGAIGGPAAAEAGGGSRSEALANRLKGQTPVGAARPTRDPGEEGPDA